MHLLFSRKTRIKVLDVFVQMTVCIGRVLFFVIFVEKLQKDFQAEVSFVRSAFECISG